MGVFEDVQAQYPTLAFLFKNPEIGKLLRDAVDPNKGFSPQTFQAKLYQTKWFRQRSQTRREFEILANTDPAELKRRIAQTRNQVHFQMAKMGFKGSSAQMKWMATAAVRDGMDVTDPSYAMQLRSLFLNNAKKFGEGAVATNTRKTRQIARNDYFMGYGGGLDKRWGIDIALGIKTEDDFRRELSARAESLYPHLKTSLSAGVTMRELFDGHRQVIAEELELDPENVNLDIHHGQWGKVIRFHDPTTKKDRALTLSETRTLARQDPRFWKTSNGKAMDAGLSNFLLTKFGARAS